MGPVLTTNSNLPLPQIGGLVPNPNTCMGDTGATWTRTHLCGLRVRPANHKTIAPTSPAIYMKVHLFSLWGLSPRLTREFATWFQFYRNNSRAVAWHHSPQPPPLPLMLIYRNSECNFRMNDWLTSNLTWNVLVCGTLLICRLQVRASAVSFFRSVDSWAN